MSANELRVTSHVARDLLQSAALFRHEQQVVWEYVSNGLEYVDSGVRPTVDVYIDVKAKKIAVNDNGRGMTRTDLERYFQMHGENVDRKKGKAGRGMFGTGKSAAFGIADQLLLTTVRNGKRSKVRLEREDIELAADGAGIPVRIVEDEVSTREPNGTSVEIEGIHLKKMDVGSVIRFVERQIAHWPNATVFVNRQECKVEEPFYSGERHFSSEGTPFEATLGKVDLIVKIAKAPLEQEWQGIAILSNNVWHTTTLAGYENKPFANYIFGELDVPRLAQDKSPIQPFDMSRSMQLNPKNELVGQILAFVGSHIDIVRRELEKADQERRKDRDAKRLQEEASEIAKIINQDFDAWRHQVQKTIAKVPGGSDRLAAAAAEKEVGETLDTGSEIPAIVLDEAISSTTDIFEPSDEPVTPPDEPFAPTTPTPKLERAEDDGQTKASPRRQSKPGASGGFKVEFLNMGTEASRAQYKREERTIYINLDHPQIAAAKSIGGIEDVAFRRLSYEVAFSEYAIALSSELAAADWYHDITDPIVDIRETLNRTSRAAAGLYSKV